MKRTKSFLAFVLASAMMIQQSVYVSPVFAEGDIALASEDYVENTEGESVDSGVSDTVVDDYEEPVQDDYTANEPVQDEYQPDSYDEPVMDNITEEPVVEVTPTVVDPNADEASAPVIMPGEGYKSFFELKSQTYEAAVVLSDEKAMSDKAEFKIELMPETSDFYKDAVKAINEKYEKDNKIIKNPQVFNMRFLVDGAETEPASGNAIVTMNFAVNNLEGLDLKLEDTENVQVMDWHIVTKNDVKTVEPVGIDFKFNEKKILTSTKMQLNSFSPIVIGTLVSKDAEASETAAEGELPKAPADESENREVQASSETVLGFDISEYVSSESYKQKQDDDWVQVELAELSGEGPFIGVIQYADVPKQSIIDNGNTLSVKLPDFADVEAFAGEVYETKDDDDAVVVTSTYVKDGDAWYRVESFAPSYLETLNDLIPGNMKYKFNKNDTVIDEDVIVETADVMANDEELGTLVLTKSFEGIELSEEEIETLKGDEEFVFTITKVEEPTTTTKEAEEPQPEPEPTIVKFKDMEIGETEVYSATLELEPAQYRIVETPSKLITDKIDKIEFAIDGSDKTEQTADVFAVADVAKATAEKEKTSVAFTNTYSELPGSLTLVKTVTGIAKVDDINAKVSFKVSGPQYSRPVTITMNSKTKWKETKPGSGIYQYTYTLKNLKAGEYTVEEYTYSVAGFDTVTTYKVDGGKAVNSRTAEKIAVVDGKDTKVEFENKYSQKLFALTITKAIKGAVDKDELVKSVAFEVTEKGKKAKTYKLKDFKTEKSGYTFTISNLMPGTYTVKEIGAEVEDRAWDMTYKVSGVSSKDDKGAATFTVDPKNPKNVTIAYTNSYSTSFSVKKMDADGNGLEGAVFQLYKADGKTKVGEEWTSKADSPYEYTDMQAGKFILKEVSAPDGYKKLTKSVKITIASDGTVSIKDHDNAKVASGKNMIEISNAKSKSKNKDSGNGKSGKSGSGSKDGKNSKKKTSVKTGDDTPIGMYVGLVAAAVVLVAIIAIILGKRKRK